MWCNFIKSRAAGKRACQVQRSARSLQNLPPHGCPQLAYGHSCWPTKGQVDLRMRSECLLHLELRTTSICPPHVQQCAKQPENILAQDPRIGYTWRLIAQEAFWPCRKGQAVSVLPNAWASPAATGPASGPLHGCLLCHLLQESSCQQGRLGGLRAIRVPDLQAHFLVGPPPLSV